MSYAMTEEHELIQSNTREFVTEYVAPLADSLDKNSEYPSEAVVKMAEQGLLGLVVPAEFGGLEAGYLSFVTSVEELSRASAATAAILVQHTVAAGCIGRWGNAEQKGRLLAGLASGELLGSVAIFENGPKLGVGAEALIARQHEHGYQLKGVKTDVGNAGKADVYVVFATAEPGDGKKLTAFIVSAGQKGIRVGPITKCTGLHGYQTADISFDDVFVSKEDMLGALHGGSSIVGWTLALAAVAEAAETVGIVATAVKHAATYSKQRVQFGRSISNFPAVQIMLAGVAANCHATRLVVLDAAALIDQGKPFEVESAMAKLLALNLGQKSLCEALQVEGGYGYSEEMALARLYRDVAGTTLRNSPAEFPEKLIAESIA